MPLPLVLAALAVAGAAIAGIGALGLGRAGARPAVARRLAGPREVRVGSLLGDDPLPSRPIRVSGRIRCPDPLETDAGERLVVYQRDVDVRTPVGWRSVERRREWRAFDVWDHDGSLALDPAAIADPPVVIPGVWRGRADELEGPLAAAAGRIALRYGPPSEARSVVRTISVTDRLLVIAQPRRQPDGVVRLDPPPGGYLVTNLALDDAMRLLGGRPRRLVVASLVAMGVGVATTFIGGVAAIVAAVIGT